MSSRINRSTRRRTRVTAAFYSVAVHPVDGSVWGTSLRMPGYVVRLNPGPNPSETALAEIYEPWLWAARR